MIEFLYRAIPVVSVIVLAIALIALVYAGFDQRNGARSLSAAVLPILVLTLIYVLNGQQPLPFLNLPLTPLIIVAAATGMGTALLVHRVPLGNVPLGELMVSALLAWIASTWFIGEDDGDAFVFSTSGLIGAATYFVFFGWKKG